MPEKNNVPEIRFAGFTDPWEQRKLGELGFAQSGIGFPNTEQGGTEGTPFFKVSDMNMSGNEHELIASNNYVTPEQIARMGWHPINQLPAIFFAKVGAAVMLNRKRLVNKPFLMDNNTMAFSMDPSLLNTQFGQSLFERLDLTCLIQVGALPSYNSSDVESITVSLPSTMDEQRQIGECLCNINDLITLHQRKYDKLCAVKKSMLDKMFPKPGETEPEIRFAGFTDPWEQRKLSELTTMHARIGWQNLRTSEFLDSGNYYLITGTDFENGYVNLSTCHYVNKDRYDQDPNIQIDNGSILITKDGTLGKVALVQGLDKPATLNAGVFNVVIRNEEIVDNGYLYQYLKAPFLLNYVAQTATGGTIKHLNQNILIDFPVSMPSKGEQELIGDAFLRLDNLITLHQRKLNLLKNTKKSLLDRMFV